MAGLGVEAEHYGLGGGPWPARQEVERVSRAFLGGWASSTSPTPGTPPASLCHICQGYYGPAFGPPQPFCATCHAFLYANDLAAEHAHPRQTREDSGQDQDHRADDSDRDSGNEEEIPDQMPVPALEADGGEDEASHQGSEDEGVNDPEPAVMPNPDEGEAVPEEVPQPVVGQEPAFDLNLEQPALAPLVENLGLMNAIRILFPNPEEREVQIERYIERQAVCSNHVEDHLPLWRPIHVVESLRHRLALLSEARPSDDVPQGLIESLPPEVLLAIFSYLDDVSLYSVGNVCRRWQTVLREYINPSQWRTLTRRRWPLFQPLGRIKDWFSTYSALMESSFCLACIYQMAQMTQHLPGDIGRMSARSTRLRHDLRSFLRDPPDGINAQPLDPNNYHWQASITGPVGSPYEGGKFFLYVKVPLEYPFEPPEVRFLSRIFHPNVSRHGDIGIDIILQHNWILALTIPKVLISIQSLLTDPYCQVCMEPQIGVLYRQNRLLFDAVARNWTRRFAMFDAIPALPKF